ncbi:MAG: DUF4956 domain-containing protein [Chthonomonas sp.]|nr:DUF4956 domain-containing protein [Chthonomonas sp.]
MPPWLSAEFAADSQVDWRATSIHLAVSLLLGLVVAVLYRAICRKETRGSAAFPTTLVMLTVLICAVTAIIGNNVAKAFSLVGALSIVRFRTVVEDTRDTAFVILAVTVGMAVGSSYLVLAGLIIVFAVLAAVIWSDKPNGPVRTMIEIKTGLGADQQGVREWLEPYCTRIELASMASTRQTTGYEYRYRITLLHADRMSELVTSLSAREQVTSVSLDRL